MILTKGLSYATRSFPSKIAIIDGDYSASYEELARRTAKLKNTLTDLGVKKGDRVAQLMLNDFRFLEIIYGVLAKGAIIVPLNTRLSVLETIEILNDSGAKVLLLHKEFVDYIPELKANVATLEHIILAENDEVPLADGLLSYEQLLQAQPEAKYAADDISEDDIAGIYYTGGTTGRSKGVMLTHKNLLNNTYHILLNIQYQYDDIYLHASPMFHLADGASTFGITLVGGTHAFVRSFTTTGVLECIASTKATCVMLVPTMINMVLNDPSFENYDLSSFKKVLYGASPMSEAVLTKAKQKLPNRLFYQCYGMTEASPALTFLKPEDHFGDQQKSCGQAVQGVEIKIIDPDGNELAEHQVGELIARGPNIMKGYWNLPEETAHALRDGWFYTGDVGFKDKNQFYYVVDRAKDMIITGGENVYSIEVENALYTHPAVLECAVFGVPDETWGEAVKAVIVLKPEQQATEDEILRPVGELLANYKVPKSIDFVAELPKSGAGKILKRNLRDQYWTAETRSIH